jgi:hypothetical protein
MKQRRPLFFSEPARRVILARRRYLSRASRDEFSGDDDAIRLTPIAVNPLKENPCGFSTHGGDVLGHNRYRRLEKIGHEKVVEANERDLVLHRGSSKSSNRAHREEVLPGEERRGWIL